MRSAGETRAQALWFWRQELQDDSVASPFRLALPVVSHAPYTRAVVRCAVPYLLRIMLTPLAPGRPQEHSYGVNSVAWSPDGRQLASGGSFDKTGIWDAASGACVMTLEVRCAVRGRQERRRCGFGARSYRRTRSHLLSG